MNAYILSPLSLSSPRMLRYFVKIEQSDPVPSCLQVILKYIVMGFFNDLCFSVQINEF